MGSGVWFKNIISKKKVKREESQRLKRYSAPQTINGCKEECPVVANVGSCALSIQHTAATKIQTVYRAYSARKSFHRIRRMARLQKLVELDSVKNQASTTLSRLHSWTNTQSQISVRRAHMVMEGRLRQKKLENQLKLEAKIQDLEVEWNGGAATMNEALARIHQREEAAVRRERAMAYAFTHQWRANSTQSFGPGNQELSKANWGWSWMDHWIAARPWESRVAALDSPKKAQIPQPNMAAKNTSPSTSKAPNGKAGRKARRVSYEAAAVKKVQMKI